MATIKELRDSLKTIKTNSAWNKGVKHYAEWMLDNLEENDQKTWNGNKDDLLNGARDWKEASWDGSWEIYDKDIAKNLSSPSELKKTDNGTKKPNAREEWLDVQARALYQAEMMLRDALRKTEAAKVPKTPRLGSKMPTQAMLNRGMRR